MANEFWHEKQSSIGYRTQSDYVTAAATGTPSNWAWMLCEPPDITFAREIESPDLLDGQAMAEAPPIVGSKHGGTLRIKMPMRSQLAAYDPSSGDPAANAEFALLADALGSTTIGSYDAADIDAGTDANTWETVAGTYKVGALYGAGVNATPIVNAIGVIKSQSGTTVELIEDTVALAVSTNDTFGFVTAYSSTAQPTPRTFRVTGDDAVHDLRLIGCMPTSFSITLNARQVPMFEIEYSFTSWAYDVAGGLQAPIEYLRLPPILGDNSGRLLIAGTSLADGSVDPGTCNVGNVSVEVTLEMAELDCHSSLQGVSNVIVTKRTGAIKFDIPIEDTDITSPNFLYDALLEGGLPISFTVQVGNIPGKLFAIVVPSAIVTAQPSYTVVKGSLIGAAIEIAPAIYSADGASTDAGNSNLRIAIG